MYVIFIILGTLLFAIFAVGSYTFFAACRQTKRRNWLDPEGLKGTDREKLYPYISHAHNWFSTHEVEDIYVQSRDGLQLYARWIPAENPRGTILLAHGYQSTPYIDFSLVLEVYHNLGMNMLIPDQRCHGKSEGKYITFGVKEWRDMTCWVDYHNEHLGNWPVILSGLSMGASTVMYMADEALPANVKGMIADCGFTSPYDIIGKVFHSVTHLPAWPFLWATDLCARIFAGFSLKEKDTRKTLQGGKYPIILAHGLSDDFVPCEMSREAYDACTSPKELLLVEGAGHGYSFLKDRERYTQTVTAFLQRNLEE
jgi:alpha-beta hydrolase superfamily lysophospholipase